MLDLTDYDVNTVASLFKQYLRDLPEPLIPHRLASRLDALTSKFPSTVYSGKFPEGKNVVVFVVESLSTEHEYFTHE